MVSAMPRPPRRILLAFAAALAAGVPLGVLAACSPGPAGGDGGSDDPGCSGLTSDCPTTPPSWQTDVQPLIAEYCLRCHGDGGIEQGQFDYTTYAGVYRNRSEMLTQLYQCQMPPFDASPPATMPAQTDRQTLVSWLACGAPDN
jgi:hypothetical protein